MSNLVNELANENLATAVPGLKLMIGHNGLKEGLIKNGFLVFYPTNGDHFC